MEDLQKYSVDLEIKTALAALDKLKQKSSNFQNQQVGFLKQQIALQQKLNALKMSGGGGGTISQSSPSQINKPLKQKPISMPKDNLDKIKKSVENSVFMQKEYTSELEKSTQEQIRQRISSAKTAEEVRAIVAQEKALLGDLKQITKEYEKQELLASKQAKKVNETQKLSSKARFMQSVENLTSPSGAEDMRSFYKQQEKDAQALSKVEMTRVNNLNRAKEAVMRTSLMLKENASEEEKISRKAIKVKLETAKTAEEVRKIVAQERVRLTTLKQVERSQQKQNFLMQRMEASSKQFAGNMISAFAVAGATTGVTKTGQDFERAKNTLTALFGDVGKANSELEYLKNLTYEMGVPLRETSKDYAKLLASVGESLPIEQSKELFENLTKASVVMGTSAEDTSGILKALSQMLAKQKIQA